jgi:hypothetical protein
LAVREAFWNDVVCRGRKLFLAMTRDSTQGTTFLNPLTTSWNDDLEQELIDWAWDGWIPENAWCDFKDFGLGTALQALGISINPGENRGNNKCFTANHFDSPSIIDDEYDDVMPAIADQKYYPYGDPSKGMKRVIRVLPTNLLPTPTSRPY